MNPIVRGVVRVLGMGALVAGGVAAALVLLAAMVLLTPLIFWIAWDLLGFGHAVGLPRLGVAGVALATLFLVVGWWGKVVITGLVFLVDPTWLHHSARVHWPAPTLRNFAAVALLALLVCRPHAQARKPRRRDTRPDRDATAA